MMPDYVITDPSGAKYKITAPEGATEADALEYVKANHDKLKALPAPAAKSGFSLGKALEPAADVISDTWQDLKAGGKEVTSGLSGFEEAREKGDPFGMAGGLAGSAGGVADVLGSFVRGPVKALFSDPTRATAGGTRLGAAVANAADQGAELIGPAGAEPALKAIGKAGKLGLEAAKATPGLVSEAVRDAPGTMAAQLGSASKLNPTEGATKAHELGYVLPPAMATADKLNTTASLLAGESGKHKLWQAASGMNQPITTSLARDTLGLPEGTPLTPQAFASVREKVGQTRNAIQEILPDLNVKGTDFEAKIHGITDASASLQEAFPNLTRSNPKIIALQQDLLNQPMMSANHAIELTRRLRSDAQANFKNRLDPDAQALAIAQIRASDAIEDLVEKGIDTAPARLSENIRMLNNQYEATVDEIKRTRDAVWKAFKRPQVQTGAPYGLPAAAPETEQALAKVAALEKKLSNISEALNNNLSKARKIDELKDRGGLIDEYKAARKLAAQSYDIEMATNSATHEVSAQRLSALRKIGRPLSGNLAEIADAYDAFAPAMQSPARFGGVEDWSVLDTTLAAQSLLHGHPAGAVMALARPLARNTVLSKPFQEKMLKRNPAATISQSVESPAPKRPPLDAAAKKAVARQARKNSASAIAESIKEPAAGGTVLKTEAPFENAKAPYSIPEEPITSNWDSTGGNRTDLAYVLKMVGEPGLGGVAMAFGKTPWARDSLSIPETKLGTTTLPNGVPVVFTRNGYGSREVNAWAKGSDMPKPSPESSRLASWENSKDDWFKVGTVKQDKGAAEHIVVAPSLRRQGLATKLTDLAVKELKMNPYGAVDRSPAGAAFLEARRKKELGAKE